MPRGPPVRTTEGGVEWSRFRHSFVHTLHKTFSLLKNLPGVTAAGGRIVGYPMPEVISGSLEFGL